MNKFCNCFNLTCNLTCNVCHSFVDPEVCVQICGLEGKVDVIGKNAKEGSKCNSSACAD